MTFVNKSYAVAMIFSCCIELSVVFHTSCNLWIRTLTLFEIHIRSMIFYAGKRNNTTQCNLFLVFEFSFEVFACRSKKVHDKWMYRIYRMSGAESKTRKYITHQNLERVSLFVSRSITSRPSFFLLWNSISIFDHQLWRNGTLLFRKNGTISYLVRKQ